MDERLERLVTMTRWQLWLRRQWLTRSQLNQEILVACEALSAWESADVIRAAILHRTGYAPSERRLNTALVRLERSAELEWRWATLQDLSPSDRPGGRPRLYRRLTSHVRLLIGEGAANLKEEGGTMEPVTTRGLDMRACTCGTPGVLHARSCAFWMDVLDAARQEKARQKAQEEAEEGEIQRLARAVKDWAITLHAGREDCVVELSSEVTAKVQALGPQDSGGVVDTLVTVSIPLRITAKA